MAKNCDKTYRSFLVIGLVWLILVAPIGREFVQNS